MGRTCRLVLGNANTSDRRRGFAPLVPHRRGAGGASGCGGGRGSPRGGSSAPSAAALSRIFFADWGACGSLALRASGRGCIAGRKSGSASVRSEVVVGQPKGRRENRSCA